MERYPSFWKLWEGADVRKSGARVLCRRVMCVFLSVIDKTVG